MSLLLLPNLRGVFLFILFLNFSYAIDFTEKEKAWIGRHTPVTLGSDYSWAPYDFVDKSGKHAGISADFLALVSKKSGLKFKIKTGVWADILKQMKEGKLDGLSCAVATEKRKKYLHFFTPYMSMPLAIVVQDSREDIKTIVDLKDKLVAVNRGSYLHEWLVEKHPEIRLKLMTSNDAALEEVSFSRVDAYIGNIAVATYIMKTHYLSNVKIAGRVKYMSTNVSIAIAKENEILQHILEKTLQEISSAEKKKIQDKWITLEFEKTVDYTLVYQILGLFLFFVLGIWYWYRKLSYEVSKRKESEEQMRMLIDNIPLNVIVSDFAGNVLRANTFALKTFKISLEDIAKYNVMEFYSDPLERDKIISIIQTEGKVTDHIIKFKHLDNSEMDIMISMIPIIYNSKKALLSIMVDLTERIEMEENLRDAKQLADRANKSKSEFLANMSHEIRTPMNAIIGFTELLDEQVTKPRLKSYTKIIKNAGYSLLTLINDILDLSKIEAGKLEIIKTAVNVNSIVNDVASIFSMTVGNKGLSIVLDIDEDIPKSLLLDGIRLRQVLVNLVGNAVKFTEEGYIKLSIHAFNVDDHLSKLDLEITVEDTGIGISQDQREKIFNSFEQQEGQDNRKFGGTGLGLAISKRLVEMMDGTIMVQSVEKKGATFFIYLYGVDISSVQMIEDDSIVEDSSKMIFKPAKVLIVDDIEDNRELIVKNFEDTAIEIITASDGIEAISQYAKEKPDLIIMDIRMPNMDGYEAANKIRAMSNIPIIALTASIMQNEYEETKSKDFNGYLRKPILRNDLFLELSHFLDYDIKKVIVKEDKGEVLVLDDLAMQNMDTILKILEIDILPLYEQAVDSNSISDIEEFSKKVDALAQKYKVIPLEEYITKLNEAIDTFDISQIQSLLREYSILKEKFKLL